MRQRLQQLWYEESAGLAPLRPLAWLYGAAVSARRTAYGRGWMRSHAVGAPVIVVGNLTVGGTGKTPLSSGSRGNCAIAASRSAWSRAATAATPADCRSSARIPRGGRWVTSPCCCGPAPAA